MEFNSSILPSLITTTVHMSNKIQNTKMKWGKKNSTKILNKQFFTNQAQTFSYCLHLLLVNRIRFKVSVLFSCIVLFLHCVHLEFHWFNTFELSIFEIKHFCYFLCFELNERKKNQFVFCRIYYLSFFAIVLLNLFYRRIVLR